MSAIKSFTAKDVCAALGDISRSRLHQWAQLPPFSERPTRERSARRFSKADLLTFAVLQTLEDAFGAKCRDLTSVSAAAYQYFNTPRQTPVEEWVFIPLVSGEAHLVQVCPIESAGWVVDVTRERERIDVYLGVRPPQQEFPLMTGVKSGRQ